VSVQIQIKKNIHQFYSVKSSAIALNVQHCSFSIPSFIYDENQQTCSTCK